MLEKYQMYRLKVEKLPKEKVAPKRLIFYRGACCYFAHSVFHLDLVVQTVFQRVNSSRYSK